MIGAMGSCRGADFSDDGGACTDQDVAGGDVVEVAKDDAAEDGDGETAQAFAVVGSIGIVVTG